MALTREITASDVVIWWVRVECTWQNVYIISVWIHSPTAEASQDEARSNPRFCETQ